MRQTRNWSQEVLTAEESNSDWGELLIYLQECDLAYAQLKLVHGDASFSADAPTVVCVARNEEDRLPHFLEHYSSLGVRNFHIIDNGSMDRTSAIARDWPGTAIWATEESYAAANFGQLWIAAVVRKHGLGRWILNVDLDEFLVYPGMEDHKLADLCSWLNDRHQPRLFAPLLDMYPVTPFDPRATAPPSIARRLCHKPGRGSTMSSWFSRVRLAMGIEEPRKQNRGLQAILNLSPYFDRRWSGDNDNYKFDFGKKGVDVRGGIRYRICKERNEPPYFCLSKYPLTFWDERTAYANVHWPYPFDLNMRESRGALLHFKFLGSVYDRVGIAIVENQHWNESCEYKMYKRWIESGHSFFSADISKVYNGLHTLQEEGLIEGIEW